MAMVLYNPTDKLGDKFQEMFRTHHLGISKKIDPGQKVKFPDATARHFLNEFAPRGLVSLEFGDKEEARAKEGLERNREFKVKQLNNFNESNSARKHMGLPYLWPTADLKRYAEEIGVKLVESYQIDDAQLQKVKTLEEENKTLTAQLVGQSKQISDLNEKMTQILEQMTKPDGEEKKTVGRPKKES